VLTDDNEFRESNPMIDTAKSKQFLALQSFYDLPLKDSAGNSVNLSELKGKLLVVDFWTSWCKPCIAEIPFINKLSHDYKSKNVEFISINLDKNSANWKKALQKNHIEGLQLGDSNSFYSLAAMYSKVLYVGRYLIVDQKGKIINYYAPHPSEPEMRTLIEKLLPDL
jgi:thiol-disulfide isomerase/thioredoxin